MDISKIDKNFQINKINNYDFKLLNGLSEPFKLEGFPFYKNNQTLYRLPKDFEIANDGVKYLASNCAGGAIRFATNSTKIILKCTLEFASDMNHMTRSGSAGADVYQKIDSSYRHVGTMQVDSKLQNAEVVINLADNPQLNFSDILINLPLYGGIKNIEIGIDINSEIRACTPHKIAKPIVFYGSSITQGGCASRPGNAYTSMLCREVDAEEINLGFSGSALGEKELAELISTLDMSLFVFDYDHNAPTVEHLSKTHEIFYKTIRQSRPDLPILLLSRVDVWSYKDYAHCQDRKAVIQQTYLNAKASCDQNIYFIDGETLFGNNHRDACTVDGCHPNDLGFYRMFENILPILKLALKFQK